MSKKNNRVVECERCNTEHYSVVGFVFPGEEQVGALVGLLKSHPEYIDWLEGSGWAN